MLSLRINLLCHYLLIFAENDILAFMEWLKSARKNEVTTINQRLSHTRSFCTYLVKNRKMEQTDLNEITEISRLHDTRKTEMICLSNEDIKLVIEQSDILKKTGIRLAKINNKSIYNF